MNRHIRRQRNQLSRKKKLIEKEAKNKERELEKMAQQGKTKSQMRPVAKQLIAKKKMVEKYEQMEAKTDAFKLQFDNIGQTQTMIEVMGKMNELMGKNADGVNINNINQVVNQFNLQLQQQETIGETIEDAMDMDEGYDDETEADKFIDEIQDRVGKGGGAGKRTNIQPNEG